MSRFLPGWLLGAVLLLLWPAPATAQSDLAAVRAAVERANSPAVWGEALRRGDPEPLAAAWEGEPLAYFTGEVLAYRARGLRLLSTLVELEFLGVRVLDDGHALAETRERWLDRVCTEAGELRGERQAVVRDRYELVFGVNGWRVSGVEIHLDDGSFDFTPALDPPDDPSPCAAVLTVVEPGSAGR